MGVCGTLEDPRSLKEFWLRGTATLRTYFGYHSVCLWPQPHETLAATGYGYASTPLVQCAAAVITVIAAITAAIHHANTLQLGR